MPIPQSINLPKQLLVEGRDSEIFFSAFISNHNLVGFQLQDFGGITELKGFIKALIRTPGFGQTALSVLIIRDAESNPSGAFQSVCSSLADAGLSLPVEPNSLTPGPPDVGVFILPTLNSPGMLESLCLQAVANDPVIKCVDDYMECIEERTGSLPRNIDKARLHAYLSSRSDPGLLLGQAAYAGYLELSSDTYSELLDFLVLF